MFHKNWRRLPTALVAVKQRIQRVAPEVHPASRIRNFRAVEVKVRAVGKDFAAPKAFGAAHRPRGRKVTFSTTSEDQTQIASPLLTGSDRQKLSPPPIDRTFSV
jgi:hypothetical protein